MREENQEVIQSQVHDVLQDTILVACRDKILYESDISVEGVLHITVDHKNIVIFKINESMKKPRRNTARKDCAKSKRGCPQKKNEQKSIGSDSEDCNVNHRDLKSGMTSLNMSNCAIRIKQEKCIEEQTTDDYLTAQCEREDTATNQSEIVNVKQGKVKINSKEDLLNMDMKYIDDDGNDEMEAEIPMSGHLSPKVSSETDETTSNNAGGNTLKDKEAGKDRSSFTILPNTTLDTDNPVPCKSDDRRNIDKSNDQKCLKCSYCDKTFSKRYYKRIHERTHTGEKPYNCDFCNKSFTDRARKVIHQRIHTGEKPFKCSFCEKRFYDNGERKKCESVHTGRQRYKCSFCAKGFTVLKNMKRHERVHTGEKPYQCSFCGRKFAEEDTMKNHEKLHTGEKPYQCSYCDLRFIVNHRRKEHEKSHTGEKPFQCRFCGKRFSLKSTMIAHERIHTGEKPYSCSFCDKTFSHLSSQISHERIHTGEKPYKCDLCDSAFIHSGDLKKHKNSKHTPKTIDIAKKPYKCGFCENRYTEERSMKRHERIHTGEKLQKCNFCCKTFVSNSAAQRHEKTHNKNEWTTVSLAHNFPPVSESFSEGEPLYASIGIEVE